MSTRAEWIARRIMALSKRDTTDEERNEVLDLAAELAQLVLDVGLRS